MTEHLVARLADRLADPAALAARVTAAETPELAETRSLWHSQSLADGHAGVALLFAALAHGEPGYAKVAHAHLSAAVTKVSRPAREGLYAGLPAVAFAARTAVTRPGAYGGLLAKLDGQVALLARRLVEEDAPRVAAGTAGARMAGYDVVAGLSGIGRLLLAAGPEHRDTTDLVLAHLVALTRPVTEPGGRTVPGWWTGDPILFSEPDGIPGGHFNAGLAHGIPGPLALLSLAHRAGVCVPGQEQAIRTIAEWLLARRSPDGLGWPNVVPLEAELAAASGTRPGLAEARTGWCYGTPGVARALQLAALALKEPDWNRQAVAAVAATCDRPGGARAFGDPTLCHGLAGLTTIVALMAREPGGAELAARIPELTEALARAAGPAHPFLWPAAAPGGSAVVHRPGFLDGAAGAALALRFATSPDAPLGELPWQAALLLC
ncbi:lanthionine synthetase C family protein [Streptomyces spectabilis]|uniref:Lanthionine synthetase C family protein n=1 Tax=Streptomyces spectabilis TaxID=68270 RepID=A0A516R0S3_STRST|nr:lanthionine synthetase C family protein [Streptomyces spectabilis]QDQ09254.1 lanthionine synthetase C family protein [Streptomyces spectabilis]